MTLGQRLGPLIVRAALDADMAAIQRLYAAEVATGTATFEEEAPSVSEMTARRAACVSHGCPYLVAEQAGVVVGFATAGPFRARSAYRFTVENTVYVDPAAARKGVARALMERVIADCRDAGFAQMVAVIGDENPASVGFHTAMGFTLIGRLERVGFKHGRWLDTTLMQRALEPDQF